MTEPPTTEPCDDDERVDRILFACLDRPEDQWPAAVEQACREHRGLAARLDERFRMLRSFGMTANGGPERRKLGDYDLIRPIGGGAMGTVFLARRAGGEGPVAVKILHPGLQFSPAAQRRFAREQTLAMRLRHPGICAVIEIGSADGVPFIVMEYVEGQSLAERIACAARAGAHPDTEGISQVLAIIEGAARALDAAHAEGLVHRDVKPGNIIVRDSGQAVLLDFGLARDVDESAARLTHSGSLLGSPAYLAPEAIDGRAGLDGQGDVYSLGVTLFECLTLELPYSAPTREALFHKVLGDPAPDPRRRNAAVSAELARVVGTAMARQPGQRYASALAFADDLAAVGAGRAVAARAPTLLRRCQAWTRRYPIVTVFLLMLALGLATTAMLLHKLSSGLSRTHALGLAAFASSSEPELALLLATRAVEHFEHPVTVTELQAAVARYHRRVVTPALGGPVRDGRFRPGGAGTLSLSSSLELQICDANGRLEARLEGVLNAEPGPQPDQVLIRREDGAFLWRAGANALVPVVSGRVLAIRVVGSETLVVALAADGLARLHRSGDSATTALAQLDPEGWVGALIAQSGQVLFLEDGTQITRLDGSGKVLSQVPGERLLSCSRAGDSWVVRHGRGRSWYRPAADSTSPSPPPMRTFDRESTLFRLSASGQRLAVCQRRLSVRIYGALGQVIGTIPAHGVPVSGLSFSPDGRFLATGGGDAVARLYADDGSLSAEFHGHGGHVTHTVFSPDGGRLATGSYDGRVRIFQIQPGVEHVLDGSRSPVLALDTDASGRVLWVDDDGELWLAQEGTRDRIASEVSKAVFGREREILASFRDGRFQVIDAAGERPPRTLAQQREQESPIDLSLSSDREWLVAVARMPAARRSFVGLWKRAEDWTCVATWEVHASVLSAAVSPGGARIAAVGRDGLVRIYDTGGEPLSDFQAHDDWVWSVRFSPQGDALLTTSRDNTACLWSLSGTRLGQFREHARTVSRGVFSPNGEWIATASTDHTVGIWERSGRLRTLLRGHRGQVWDVAFSRDGQSVLSAGYDRDVRVWPLQTERLLELARSLVDRPLSARERELLGDFLGR